MLSAINFFPHRQVTPVVYGSLLLIIGILLKHRQNSTALTEKSPETAYDNIPQGMFEYLDWD